METTEKNLLAGSYPKPKVLGEGKLGDNVCDSIHTTLCVALSQFRN